MWQNNSVPQVRNATPFSYGKAKLSNFTPEGKAGAIYSVEAAGGLIGTLHIHTINFDGVQDAGNGIADVTQTGPAGPKGPPGPPGTGPAGPQGPSGQGIDISRVFNESPLFDAAVIGNGGSYSYTQDYGTTVPQFPNSVLFLTGGTSSWNPGAGADSQDHYIITDITLSGKVATIFGQIPVGAFVNTQHRMFLNAGGF